MSTSLSFSVGVDIAARNKSRPFPPEGFAFRLDAQGNQTRDVQGNLQIIRKVT